MSKPQGVTPALDLAERLWEWIDGFSEDGHKLLCDDLRAASKTLRDQSATIEAQAKRIAELEPLAGLGAVHLPYLRPLASPTDQEKARE